MNMKNLGKAVDKSFKLIAVALFGMVIFDVAAEKGEEAFDSGVEIFKHFNNKIGETVEYKGKTINLRTGEDVNTNTAVDEKTLAKAMKHYEKTNKNKGE